MKARLKDWAALPILHYTLQKYVYNSLKTPYFLSSLGFCIQNTSLKCLFLLLYLENFSSWICDGIVKNQEVRMKRWGGERSCGIIFSPLMSFQNFFSCKLWKTTEKVQVCFRETLRDPLAIEPMKDYYYTLMYNVKCFVSAIWSQSVFRIFVVWCGNELSNIKPQVISTQKLNNCNTQGAH